MREYKFRVWDGINMTYPEMISILDGGKYWQIRPNDNYDSENHPLMQYTGLKDKNGVEIYEGDIISIESEAPQIVKWNQELGRWGMSFIEGATTNIPKNAFVAGNIYENKELLK